MKEKIVQFIKKYRIPIIITTAVLLVLIVTIAVIRQRVNINQQYQTAELRKGDLSATIGAAGTVRAKQMAYLTWQTSGTVDTVEVQTDEWVKADDVLATLTQASLPQSVLQAQADLVNAQRALKDLQESKTSLYQAEVALYKAQDELDKAQDRYDSRRSYYGENSTARQYLIAKAQLALAQEQVNDAQRTYDRLKDGPNEADLAAAQARVSAAEAALRLAHLIAPFNGIVTEVNPKPGDQVTPGAAGIRIDDISSLFVDVQISEVDINSIQVEQPVTLTFDAILGEEYHGEVISVAKVGNTDQGVVNFTVTVELSDEDEQVKPGMTAAVTIVVNQVDNVLLIPNRAVRIINGQRTVYVLQKGRINQFNISLGAMSDIYSELTGGDLQEGDLIILNPPVVFSSDQHPSFLER